MRLPSGGGAATGAACGAGRPARELRPGAVAGAGAATGAVAGWGVPGAGAEAGGVATGAATGARTGRVDRVDTGRQVRL